MTKTITARQFNQDTSGAKRAAKDGPVFITDRGQPSHVLLSLADYERLVAGRPSISDILSQPEGVADVELEITPSRELPRAASFD